jgi:hypothetical protein
MGMAICVPEVLLWLIGNKYSHLQPELAWMMASSCVSYLVSVLFTMHSARRWVFHWCSWAYIVVIILTQIAGLLLMDLGTTRNVLIFTLYNCIAAMLVHVACGLVGFAAARDDD